MAFLCPSEKIQQAAFDFALSGNLRYICSVNAACAELLSRSRFLAPATHGLRFYREYFQPAREIEVGKERLRWKIRYRNTEFFVNFDSVSKPALPGRFLEVKARTWSRKDAEDKAGMIVEIVRLLGAENAAAFREDYVEMAGK